MREGREGERGERGERERERGERGRERGERGEREREGRERRERRERGETERERGESTISEQSAAVSFCFFILTANKKHANSFPPHQTGYKLISLLIGTMINKITLPTAVFSNCLFIYSAGFRREI